MQPYKSISVTAHQHSEGMNIMQKVALSLVALGFLAQLVYWLTFSSSQAGLWMWSSLAAITIGSLLYTSDLYKDTLPGIKNNGVWMTSISSRGMWAWMLGVFLTGFYVLLYWYPHLLGQGRDGLANTGLVGLFDPLSMMLKGKPASQWFVYGSLYTLAILLLGIKFIYKYRHSKYQVYRTISIMFFQTAIAFILPEILVGLNLPYNDFKNVWPLNYYFFFDWHITELIESGLFGYFVLFWGVFLFLVVTPVMTYFYGKRWYCSWVCGCGGLAETAGDPFRQLSDKSLKAWKIERWMIHGVLVFVTIMTAMVLYTRFTGNGSFLFLDSYQLSSWYGFFIGSAFSGVVGVGFYPLMGSRVWCRFGCPMAAYLGLLQKVNLTFKIGKKEHKLESKFRITTNGGQCISCGNCSTYCEMGIDVKSYAQRQEDILRSSCVGCGICSAVCPRGVLRLENL
ncbi:MAG: 4Fe-4S binding protein [Saprospiraceae bacterium]|nr:4Fe-4S binding protein [Saprospiraceae bacterium]